MGWSMPRPEMHIHVWNGWHMKSEPETNSENAYVLYFFSHVKQHRLGNKPFQNRSHDPPSAKKDVSFRISTFRNQWLGSSRRLCSCTWMDPSVWHQIQTSWLNFPQICDLRPVTRKRSFISHRLAIRTTDEEYVLPCHWFTAALLNLLQKGTAWVQAFIPTNPFHTSFYRPRILAKAPVVDDWSQLCNCLSGVKVCTRTGPFQLRLRTADSQFDLFFSPEFTQHENHPQRTNIPIYDQ